MDRLLSLYVERAIGHNEICAACKASNRDPHTGFFSDPLAAWNVGPKFNDDKHRLVFVGKVARGNPCEDPADRKTAEGTIVPHGTARYLYFNPNNEKQSPFWGYTRDVLVRLYGDAVAGWEHVAWTNILKCNNTPNEGLGRTTLDMATPAMKTNCLDRLGVAWAELAALRAKTVVFYTAGDYDDYIDRWRVGDSFKDIEGTNRTTRRPNGKGNIRWWVREFYQNDQPVLRFLRTSHPERKNREDFVSAIVNWINGGSADHLAATNGTTALPILNASSHEA